MYGDRFAAETIACRSKPWIVATAHFYITGIWKTESGKITHLCLHTNEKNGFSKGSGQPITEVIGLIKAGKIIATLKWNYAMANWAIGAKIELVKEGAVEYLRTRKDAAATDRLESLINMNPFNISVVTGSFSK